MNIKKKKLFRLSYISKEVDNICESFEDHEVEESFILKFKGLFRKTLFLVQNLSIKEEENSAKQEKIKHFVKMAQFDLSLVGKNLQVFKGVYETLEDFLVQSELLHDMLRDEDKETFVKYVYNFKLTAHVRSVVGRSNRPVTFSDLKKILLEAYPNPRTLQQVLAEFGTIRQGGLNISAFREKIAVLSEQLSDFEIKALENPTRETKQAIYKMSESMALNVFMKGVNAEYQNILIASGPKTLSEAVEKCLTLERNLSTSGNNIFRLGRRHQDDYYGSQRNNANFSQYRNRNQGTRNGNFNSHINNYNNSSGNRNNSSGNYNNSSNGYNSYNSNNRGNNNRNNSNVNNNYSNAYVSRNNNSSNSYNNRNRNNYFDNNNPRTGELRGNNAYRNSRQGN